MIDPLDAAARIATDEARRARETLREAYGCLNDAVDQLRRTVAGGHNHLPAQAVERWVGGLTLTNQVSTLVDGLFTDARRRARPALLPDVVMPLHEALGRAHQYALSVRLLRQDAERTERRLRRRAGGDPALTAIATRWGVAARRLDGLVARLEAGARALDAYLDQIVFGTDHGAVRRTRLAGLLPAVRQPAADVTRDAAWVGRLVALGEPWRERTRNVSDRGLWSREPR